MIWNRSIGRRLLSLVLCEGLIALCLVLVGFRTLQRAATDAEHIYRYQLLSVEDLGRSLAKAAELQSHFRPGRLPLVDERERREIDQIVAELEEFYFRHRRDWERACGLSEGSDDFRRDLEASDHTDILERENRALATFRTALDTVKLDRLDSEKGSNERHWAEANTLRQSLGQLLELGIECATISHEQLQRRAVSARWVLAVVGVLGTLLTLLTGYRVRASLSPRLERLVEKVNRFKEKGMSEPIVDASEDEIAILTRALETGFASIGEREKQREIFLDTMAVELRTPTTSIQGFAKVLLQTPPGSDAHVQALEMIRRQSWRLARLVEGLFLSMRIRHGHLSFQPQVCDLSELAGRVLAEFRAFAPGQKLESHIHSGIRALADEVLLEHALWNMLTCASAVSGSESVMVVELGSAGTRARLQIRSSGAPLSTDEIEALYSPFRGLAFQSGGMILLATGLHLSREILRMHGGQLPVFNDPSSGPVFSFELPL